MNPKLTAKERGLIKGALRRIFSRSDVRRRVVDSTIVPTAKVPEADRLARPRVKTWVQCPVCSRFTAKSDIEVDHHDPIVPVDRSLEEMTEIELVDRVWSEENNLKPMCWQCHDVKTKAERALRTAKRKEKKYEQTGQANQKCGERLVPGGKRRTRKPKA